MIDRRWGGGGGGEKGDIEVKKREFTWLHISPFVAVHMFYLAALLWSILSRIDGRSAADAELMDRAASVEPVGLSGALSSPGTDVIIIHGWYSLDTLKKEEYGSFVASDVYRRSWCSQTITHCCLFLIKYANGCWWQPLIGCWFVPPPLSHLCFGKNKSSSKGIRLWHY